MTSLNSSMTGEQINDLMATAVRMQSDSEQQGNRDAAIFAYAVQVAVLDLLSARAAISEAEAQVKQLAAERDRLLANERVDNKTIALLVGEKKALAAECESKKSALAAILDHCPVNHPHIDAAVAAMIAHDNLYCQKTPATDAFLSRLRNEAIEGISAYQWIEGSEPLEFGRYWVRYETDVGPQYCSAKWMEYNFCASSNTNIHKIWLADHSRSINALRNVTHTPSFPMKSKAVPNERRNNVSQWNAQ